MAGATRKTNSQTTAASKGPAKTASRSRSVAAKGSAGGGARRASRGSHDATFQGPAAGAQDVPIGTLVNLPWGLRLEVDKALIREVEPLASILAVYQHFELKVKCGVEFEDFHRHAVALREAHKTAYADRLACALLSDRSDAEREAEVDLLTSRLIGRIARILAEAEEIGVSDLARLASSAASLQRAMTQAERSRLDRLKAEGPSGSPSTRDLHRAVRDLYGVAAGLDQAEPS